MTVLPLGQVPAVQAARRGANQWAIRYDDAVLTWGELEDHSNRRAWALQALGVRQDDLVTLAVDNGTEAHELAFAVWKLGATPHFVSSHLPEPELRAILELSRPRVVIADNPQVAVRFDAKHPEAVWDGGRNDAPPEVVAKRWRALSSGGSTGRPKIILAPEPSALDTAANAMLRMPKDGAVLTPGPLYHSMPMATSTWALRDGLSVVGTRRFDPEAMLRLIERHRISWTGLVPTMMMRVSRLPADVRQRFDISCLKTVWHWGAAMPAALKRQWIDWIGPDAIWELYGGSEALGTTIINGRDWLAHPGSVGRPVTDRISIRDEDGREVPAGTVGEIFAMPPGGRGSSYSYVGAVARNTPDGYETLGDFGWVDEDGFLFIADRRTDMIVSGGANLFPAEIEGALMAHPEIEDAVVIGLPNEDLGTAAHAIVKPAQGSAAPPDAEKLRTFLRGLIAPYKIPRSFEVTNEPLRNEAGKVRRSALIEQRSQAFEAAGPTVVAPIDQKPINGDTSGV